ncbi:uncharacterized protein LOC110828692 [Zootermopsis nevadensis]|uniref:uncharacterized protein LOC110828692 n=1 Tax=Zootermopsis nevadensis TaxID=136037 RepID=UPI000B8E4681|nr:uncharacterized protein LOC110828692 [Zootermopsis nevadensis]
MFMKARGLLHVGDECQNSVPELRKERRESSATFRCLFLTRTFAYRLLLFHQDVVKTLLAARQRANHSAVRMREFDCLLVGTPHTAFVRAVSSRLGGESKDERKNWLVNSISSSGVFAEPFRPVTGFQTLERRRDCEAP